MYKVSTAPDLNNVRGEVSKLYVSITPPIWFDFLNKYFKNQDDQDQEDSFADGWANVLVHRSCYKKEAVAFNWVYAIIKNVIINYFNSYKYKNQQNLPDGDNGLLPPYIIVNGVSEEVEIDDLVDKTLVTLEKQVFYLYVVDGFKQQEIAKEIGKSIGATNKILHSALNKLKCEIQRNDIRGLLHNDKQIGLLNGRP